MSGRGGLERTCGVRSVLEAEGASGREGPIQLSSAGTLGDRIIDFFVGGYYVH